MKNAIDSLLTSNKVICTNIKQGNIFDRGFLSQNILSHLRTFLEAIIVKIYTSNHGLGDIYNWDNIGNAIDYIKSRGDLKFINKFHQALQISTSHYITTNENAERLMLKYYEYLIQVRLYLKNTYCINVLQNLSDFPINTDTTFVDYYSKISEQIERVGISNEERYPDGRYYVQKVKPFFVNENIYYEVTLSPAIDFSSKFDRVIAFTQFNMLPNYSVKLSIINAKINVFDKYIPIKIIDKWSVSIRPCEITNFYRLFGITTKSNIQNTKEYLELMKYITKSGHNLLDIVDLADIYYLKLKNDILSIGKTHFIFDFLDMCRDLIKTNSSGSNIIRYLLFIMNNKVIKAQYNFAGCERLSNLCLDYGCIPFDDMPFISSPKEHNPKGYDLFEAISTTGREHELLARFIHRNTEYEGKLYTSITELGDEPNLDALISKYNDKLYYKHRDNRKLVVEGKNIFINSFEKDTLAVIRQLIELSKEGVKGYQNSFETWLNDSGYVIDCDEKKSILKKMFNTSKLSIIYGAAGTGKSTMISHISNFFDDKEKIFLANTHPAVENLKRRVNASNCFYSTIASFLSDNNSKKKSCDILIIDECSTVSNSDMRRILEKAEFQLMILVGDVYQIESIFFGNWFNIARTLIPNNAINELTVPYRSKNKELQDLWNKVRTIDENIIEYITKHDYSKRLDKSILTSIEEDEIILCLNYDGLYGINNINRFLQNNNQNPEIEWGINTYKIGDPILFNESTRFSPVIYNNLKGKIVDITKGNDKIWFDIEVDKAINGLDVKWLDLELLDDAEPGKSVVRFYVNAYKDADEDDDINSNATVPFVVAYAVSIHKSQGLEYNSVKVVITNEIEEMITHNVFYTAITRARNTLNIYWTPECEKQIISNLKLKNNDKDACIIKNKL